MTHRVEAAAGVGSWLVIKDWRDLFRSKRNTGRLVVWMRVTPGFSHVHPTRHTSRVRTRGTRFVWNRSLSTSQSGGVASPPCARARGRQSRTYTL